jgi:hypothetical protein
MEWCPSPAPSSPHPSRSPEWSPPNRAPPKGDAPSPEPSKYLLKFPVNRLPRFPKRSLRRQALVCRTFFYTFPSKSPTKEPPPPSMFPNRFPMEREASFPKPMVYSFIYICRGPQEGALPRKMGKTFGHRPRSLTLIEGLHTMGCGLVPQGNHLQGTVRGSGRGLWKWIISLYGSSVKGTRRHTRRLWRWAPLSMGALLGNFGEDSCWRLLCGRRFYDGCPPYRVPVGESVYWEL